MPFLTGPWIAGEQVPVLSTVTALLLFPLCFVTAVWLTPGGTCIRGKPPFRGCAWMGLTPPELTFLPALFPGSQVSTPVISIHVLTQTTLLS